MGASVNKRRERERQHVRELIIAAARELFVLRGYDAVTMRGIAGKIDYSAAAIYFHFASKEALLKEICTRDFRSLAVQFTSCDSDTDPVEKLIHCGDLYIRFAVEHPSQYRFMFMTYFPEANLTDGSIQKYDPAEDAYAYLKGCVTECMAAGKFRSDLDDPELVAQTLWAGMHGVASLYILKGHDDWIEWRGITKASQAMRDALLQGLLRERTPKSG
jgi:AcrR family transcriptional regulator